jgi:hypothetical protein
LEALSQKLTFLDYPDALQLLGLQNATSDPLFVSFNTYKDNLRNRIENLQVSLRAIWKAVIGNRRVLGRMIEI